ncbi:MAG TPA: DUF373 family protein, partial [Methanocorpusculum sp.]|nr:DUF373 family protein [Methanocorpusculum sp.]
MSDKTLILNIDRDDDIGYKSNIISPVIGREACLDTVNKLALSDPEDSDMNAIFKTIKVYDDLKSKGNDVEIAIIGGDHMNMIAGDAKISNLIKSIVESTGVDSCILVSDGMEDEFVIPIIQSYIKIKSV